MENLKLKFEDFFTKNVESSVNIFICELIESNLELNGVIGIDCDEFEEETFNLILKFVDEIIYNKLWENGEISERECLIKMDVENGVLIKFTIKK